MPSKTRYVISVIVPAHNEEKTIVDCLSQPALLQADEIIVSDSASTDDTVKKARGLATVVRSQKGRAHALNDGARHAKGNVFLFLHVDSFLPNNWRTEIESALDNEKIVGGAFSHAFTSNKIHYTLLSWVNSLRSRVTKHYYGDQGIFVRKSVFENMGGFPIIFAEDLEFTKTLCKVGKTIQLKSKVKTSPRLFEKIGFWKALCYYGKMRLLRMAGRI